MKDQLEGHECIYVATIEPKAKGEDFIDYARMISANSHIPVGEIVRGDPPFKFTNDSTSHVQVVGFYARTSVVAKYGKPSLGPAG